MVEVGLFRLPGVIINDTEDDPINESVITEMRLWANNDPKKHGKEMCTARRLWAFKNEKQRNYFIMRWG